MRPTPQSLVATAFVLFGTAACSLGGTGTSAQTVPAPTISHYPSSYSTSSPASATSPASPAGRSAATDDQRTVAMMDDLTAVFENSAITPQYDFIRDQHDGCGFTAGWIGFCTADGDLLAVVEAYDKQAPGNPLHRYLPTLRHLASVKSEETSALGAAFQADWRKASRDPLFRRVQLRVGHDSYLVPARKVASKEGITTPLGLENLFDTALMMGPGPTDCDGVLKLAAETDRAGHGSPATGVREADWLRRFNDLRMNHMRHPCTPGRQADWPKAIGRAHALQQLADAGNWRLEPPLRVASGYNLTIAAPND